MRMPRELKDRRIEDGSTAKSPREGARRRKGKKKIK
jgi:hypothetical protein